MENRCPPESVNRVSTPRDFRTLATMLPPWSPMAEHPICDTDSCSTGQVPPPLCIWSRDLQPFAKVEVRMAGQPSGDDQGVADPRGGDRRRLRRLSADLRRAERAPRRRRADPP